MNFTAGQTVDIFVTAIAPQDLDSSGLLLLLGALGGTSVGRSVFTAADASAALTLLGVSTFAKTILDDADGSTAWITLGSATNNAGNGYFKLPSGVIMQYGTINPGGGVSDFTLNYPISFPTACRALIPVPVYNNSGSNEIALCNVSSIGTSSCSIRTRYILGTAGPILPSGIVINWMGVGY